MAGIRWNLYSILRLHGSVARVLQLAHRRRRRAPLPQLINANHRHNRSEPGHQHVFLRIPDISLHSDELFAALRAEDGRHARLHHFVDGAERQRRLDGQIIPPPAAVHAPTG